MGPETRVKAIVVSGATVYIGGNFSHIGGQPRNGLAAIDAATGNATPWNPMPLWSREPANTSVGLIAVAGSTVIIAAGQESLFDSIGGVPRDQIGAIDAVTGKVKPWTPNLAGSGIVTALLVAGSTLYLGGYFDGHLRLFPLTEVTR